MNLFIILKTKCVNLKHINNICILVCNPAEARRDAARREKHLEKLKEELAKLKKLDGSAHSKAHCRFNSYFTYKKYLSISRWTLRGISK